MAGNNRSLNSTDTSKVYRCLNWRPKSGAAVVQWLARLPGMQAIRGLSPGRDMTDFCTSIFICLY